MQLEEMKKGDKIPVENLVHDQVFATVLSKSGDRLYCVVDTKIIIRVK